MIRTQYHLKAEVIRSLLVVVEAELSGTPGSELIGADLTVSVKVQLVTEGNDILLRDIESGDLNSGHGLLESDGTTLIMFHNSNKEVWDILKRDIEGGEGIENSLLKLMPADISTIVSVEDV